MEKQLPAFFYHIVTPAQWQLFADSIYYEAPSLHTEGFIHASTAEQVEATINRYYKGEPMVLLLKIEVEKLSAELKYELAPSVNEYFPHIYGRLNKDAIIEITVVYASEDGSFRFS
ncbi:MAG: DUF952 domain-containing protein [Bacteroidota bacterium]